MPIDVDAVRGFSDLREFVALPYRLHEGTPWIPPLKLERYAFLTPKLNPFFTHGTAEYFLARRDGRVVGRACAQVDFAFNQYHGSRWGNFGFLEFEEDRRSSTLCCWLPRGGSPRTAAIGWWARWTSSSTMSPGS
jgi:hypothetical protein